MEVIVVIATITAFFSHFLIEKGAVANTVSVLCATLITWFLAGNHTGSVDAAYLRSILITVVIALAISMIVGLVFAYHKRCSK